MKLGLSKWALAAALAVGMGGCAAVNTTVDTQKDVKVIAAPAKAPDLVDVDVTAVDGVVKAGETAEVVARIRVGVDALSRERRGPVNLALAVDTSGSMLGEPIERAKKACAELIDALNDGDRLAIVTFDSRPEVLVASTALDASTRYALKKRVGTMQARGTTDMGGGLSLALSQVLSYQSAEGVSRVVLLGDGMPNDPTTLVSTAQQAKQRGVVITSLGLGLDYDETLMTKVAQLSGGKFHYVRTPDDVSAVLRDEVLKIERIAGRGGNLKLVAGPGVTFKEVVGYDVALGPITNVMVGDLVAGETRDIIVRLEAPARAAGAVIELLDAELHYQDAIASAGPVEERGFGSLRASDDAEEIRASHDTEVERAAAHASVAALVLQAIASARQGQLDHARQLVDRAEKLARERGRALDDDALSARASEMPQLKKSLPSLVIEVPPTPVGGLPQPTPPRPSAAPTAAEAATVREAHSMAVETLQGG